jgi:hypothetical protein
MPRQPHIVSTGPAPTAFASALIFSLLCEGVLNLLMQLKWIAIEDCSPTLP